MSPSTQVANYCARFDGARIYARGFYELVQYHGVWTPPDRSWRRYRHLSGGWVHRQWPGLVLWLPGPNDCVVLGRAKHLPELQVARAFGSFALGSGRQPVAEVVVPTALRLPLRPLPGAQPPIPARYRRCWPIRPTTRPFHPTLLRLYGEEVELRASVTRDQCGETYFAEAILGGPHVTTRGRPRVEFFPADARHLVWAVTPDQIAQIMSSVLFRLLAFADGLRDLGLEVDAVARLQLPEVGSVRHVPHVDDVLFDVKLPTAHGDVEFKSFYWDKGYALAPAAGLPPVVPAVA